MVTELMKYPVYYPNIKETLKTDPNHITYGAVVAPSERP